MALHLNYYGQNIGFTEPNVTLTGDPGTDQGVLSAAGYLGGKIMAIVGTATDGSPLIAPCDSASMVPFGVLLNGPGEFAGAIGPAGSKKAPVVRGMFQGDLSSESYVSAPTAPYAIGAKLYCGTAGTSGFYTSDASGSTIGTCTHVPTATEPWLGVASLL
jgi:hypothetical protein